MKVVDASEIFKIGRKRKYKILLYVNVKTYASKTGWKSTINRSYIKCSCYKKAKPNDNCFHNGGSINKCCEWKVKTKATKFEIFAIKEGKNAGKNIQKPILGGNVPVIVSKAQCEHTGT